MQTSTLYTRPEVATALGISISRVDQLLREGKATRSIRTASGRQLFSEGDLAALAKAIKREDRLDGKAA